jgi:caa(3)-type oxidase subunit IV
MSNAEHDRPNYVVVWAWLLLLLGFSLAAVYLPFSQPVTVLVIFVIAGVKAFLVAANFMHLKLEQRLINTVAIAPVVLFVILTLTLLPDIVYSH